MGRKTIDCRDYKTDVKCSVSISADTNEELVEAVVQHGTKVHGYEDNAEFRAQILKDMKE
jgi:predicted small metal-binding protein